MSDPCKCDHCGKRGSRPRGRLAPLYWLFLETRDEDGEILVTWACSSSCALAMWKKGPGKLDLTDESSASRVSSAAPAFEEFGYLEYGLVKLLTEHLGISAEAVRATALSRARADLGKTG